MIIFLHGSDTYRSRQKLAELQAKFKHDVDPQGYNLTMVDGKEGSIGQVMDALSSAPFMASKRMVVLEEYSLLKPSDKEEASFIDYMGELLDQENILVIWEGAIGKRDLNKKVFKAIMATKYVMPFEAWDDQQVAGWMHQEFQQAGLTIEAVALQYLSLAVGNDLWIAASEVKKLIAYAQAKSITMIDQDMVKLLVAGGAIDNIFDLVDAVSTGNQKDAMIRLHDQIRSGSHELQIATMLVRQFRLLQQIKDGLDQQMQPDQIAKTYGMHPFVAKKMSGQARRISHESIKKCYEELVEVDQAIKSSGLSPTTLLSTSVARIVQECA